MAPFYPTLCYAWRFRSLPHPIPTIVLLILLREALSHGTRGAVVTLRAALSHVGRGGFSPCRPDVKGEERRHR